MRVSGIRAYAWRCRCRCQNSPWMSSGISSRQLPVRPRRKKPGQRVWRLSKLGISSFVSSSETPSSAKAAARLSHGIPDQILEPNHGRPRVALMPRRHVHTPATENGGRTPSYIKLGERPHAATAPGYVDALIGREACLRRSSGSERTTPASRGHPERCRGPGTGYVRPGCRWVFMKNSSARSAKPSGESGSDSCPITRAALSAKNRGSSNTENVDAPNP